LSVTDRIVYNVVYVRSCGVVELLQMEKDSSQCMVDGGPVQCALDQ